MYEAPSSISTVKKRATAFKRGRENVYDDSREGCPKNTTGNHTGIRRKSAQYNFERYAYEGI